jgi:hypothetical protein
LVHRGRLVGRLLAPAIKESGELTAYRLLPTSPTDYS